MVPYRIIVMDDYGMEADTEAWSSGYSPRGIAMLKNGLLDGVTLPAFPRRSKEFTIRLYATDNKPSLIGEFKIPNRLAGNYPVWTASHLPIIVETNGAEISITAFENEKRNARVNLRVLDHAKPPGNWSIQSISATSATGESRIPFAVERDDRTVTDKKERHNTRAFEVTFQGAFWLEEPAWKLNVKLLRGANFPSEELWNITNLPAHPKDGETQGDLTTNINGSELGFSLIPAHEVTSNGQRALAPITFRVRSPYPSLDEHLIVADVRDENRTSIAFHENESHYDTGGRGTTVRELVELYELENAGNPKTLDITLAYSKSIFVEFLAKPSVANTNTPPQ
jgi:hypothetical protein